jgi:hypothetical protein
VNQAETGNTRISGRIPFFGSILVLVAAGLLENYFENGQWRPLAAYRAAGFLICGIAMIGAACFVYRRNPDASFFYAGSWALNFLGFIALGLTSNYRPAWLVLLYAAGVAVLAVKSTSQVRRALGAHRLEP